LLVFLAYHQPMIRRSLIFIWLAMAATTVNAVPAKRMHPTWLVGRWDYRAVSDPRSWDCSSGTDEVVYFRDGRWRGIAIGDEGRWWVEGGKLFEITDKNGDGGGAKIDRNVFVSRIVRRVSSHELSMDGRYGAGRLVRCNPDTSGW
jgi:hypothetical protein